ncbi:MAG: hypothetical protein GQ582_04685 [Methyloprofundus sp.]|nr:hypothetical protein [Methyloprofundus sp.]
MYRAPVKISLFILLLLVCVLWLTNYYQQGIHIWINTQIEPTLEANEYQPSFSHQQPLK